MPSLRATMGIFAGLPLALCAAAAPGCSSDSNALAGLGIQCSLTSECNSPLACIFSRCHQQCNVSNDCPTGQRCVIGTGATHVCQLPKLEDSCSAAAGGSCHGTQTCGSDRQCRDTCGGTFACLGNQSCISGACFDPRIQVDQGVLDGGGGGGEDASADGTLSDATSADGGNNGSADRMASDGASDGQSAPSDSSGADTSWVPNPDAGPLTYVISNFDLRSLPMGDGGSPWSNAPSVTVADAQNQGVLGPGRTITMNDADGTQADLYILNSLRVDATASLTLSGPRPAILAVLTTVDIQGPVVVTAGAFYTNNSPGLGVGSLGSGASYCGVGGVGTAGGAAGKTYGTQAITPLQGGSAGLTPDGNFEPTAAGGGALQISAGISIAVGPSGSINAGGSAGLAHGIFAGPEGGGSGGAILLEAPIVALRGNVAANGGAGAGAHDGAVANGSAGSTTSGGAGVSNDAGSGGAGGGGAGRIRINTASGIAMITGSVSPDLTTPCATQDMIH